MKNLSLSIKVSMFLVFISLSVNAQHRRDFSKARESKSKASGYGPWIVTPTSMAYGLKSGSDVKFYINGEIIAFRSIMDAERKEFGDGTGLYMYLMMALDKYGEEIALMILDNGDVVYYNDKEKSSMMFSK